MMKVWTIAPVLLLVLASVMRLAMTTMGAPSNMEGPRYRITPVNVPLRNALIMSAADLIMAKALSAACEHCKYREQSREKQARSWIYFAMRLAHS
jgi:hypothetical protein